MATKAFKTVELTLQDDTEVTVRPCVLANLRRFMDAWKEMENAEEEADTLNVMVNCSGIALEPNFKGKFESLRGKDGEFLSSDYKTYLEEVLDLDTIYVIMEVGGGVKLNDPELLEQAVKAQLGTN